MGRPKLAEQWLKEHKVALFLITYEDGDRNPDYETVYANVADMNIKTGDSSRFFRVGVVRRNSSARQVERDAMRGIDRENAITVRRLGPLKPESDELHKHWRIVGLREFRMQPTIADEAVFKLMRENGDF
ncbi:hypothetical protein ABVB72_10145 [Rhizobium nepotum]|uniref:hypothetical protein n=1 Tax=Rhizobium nepotum TaxID=1035271 RepID=UPI00336A0D1E